MSPRQTTASEKFSSVKNTPPLLVPGRNCWRLVHADQLSFLIDGDAYYKALRKALIQAQHSIFIVSWDIDSRMSFATDETEDDLPPTFGDFLQEVLRRNSNCHAYLLNWDFSVLMVPDRELMQPYKPCWNKHKRLHFHMDSTHPLGACHHQKIVVIDDAIAFVGGMDVTHARWDTPSHAPDEAGRINIDGNPYAPFHDIQAMFSGAAAAACGELARTRWFKATGEHAIDICRPKSLATQKFWPPDVTVDISDIDVGIGRTQPHYGDEEGKFEIERFYLDAIAHARKWIYLENQYFTCQSIADALKVRLEESHGPEVMLITQCAEQGWLEQHTMGALRGQMHLEMLKTKCAERYRMLTPYIPGLKTQCLTVHSKLIIVDDDFLSLGSANLATRSMVLDTECNIMLEANGNPRLKKAIANLRNRLLGEHLDTDATQVAEQTHITNSLIATYEYLNRPGERSLSTLEPKALSDLPQPLFDRTLIDPEGSLDPPQIMKEILPQRTHKRVSKRLIGLGILGIAFVTLAVLWRWTPLGEWLHPSSLVDYGRQLAESRLAPLFIITAYVVSGLLVIPVMLLAAVTGMVLGPITGSFYAVIGSLCAATVTYGIGNFLGHDTIRRFGGKRVNHLNQRLVKHGVLAIIIIRLLPIAPFSIVNILAGASHLGLRNFLLGTLIGTSPGLIAAASFSYQVLQTIREPSALSLTILALIIGAVIGLAFTLHKCLKHKPNAWAVSSSNRSSSQTS